MEQREINEIKKRLEALEQDRDGIVENEKLLLTMARFHRAGLKVLDAKVDRIELAQGDANERLDKIEQKLKSYDKRFDNIDDKLDRQGEVLDKLLALMQKGTS